MTYPLDSTRPQDLLETIADNGLECLPDLFRVRVNAVLLLERQKHLNAAPRYRKGLTQPSPVKADLPRTNVRQSCFVELLFIAEGEGREHRGGRRRGS
ncbi:MAG TPA: hypothetical protein VFB21_06505 [Chthonomonadaceae bacterium]|nr:hypothetical protein [Chthonomonadaceae bacterium]